MHKYNQPEWWKNDYDSAWDRVKAAFKRDWDQTKHDFGGDEPDTNQDATDTVAQAAGKQPIPPRGMVTDDVAEYAYRFGYGARQNYGRNYPHWDDGLEQTLVRDWGKANPDAAADWERHRDLVRAGYDLQIP